MNTMSILFAQDCYKIMNGIHEAFPKGSKKVNNENTCYFLDCYYEQYPKDAKWIAEDLKLFPFLLSINSDLNVEEISWISNYLEQYIESEKKT